MRLNNLNQTLRLLHLREGKFLEECELVLVSQSGMPEVETVGFHSTKSIDLNLPLFSHPKMCNVGVSMSSAPVIAIMDSDRVLPRGYFSRVLPVVLPGTVISTHHMIVCVQPQSDYDIESGQFPYLPDHKTKENLPFAKNAWSGNTCFLREDYLKCGGMDERFDGYGFVDNDVYETFRNAGYSYRYTEDQEIHLYHSKSIIVGGCESKMDEFYMYLLRNALLYCHKWKKSPPPAVVGYYKRYVQFARENDMTGTDIWRQINALSYSVLRIL